MRRGENNIDRGGKTKMNILASFYGSSLGKKYVMGITGLLLFAFVVVHMAGNLQVFLGPDALNNYALLLKSSPLILWGTRIGLLVVALLHIVSALQLARENQKARPVKYATGKPIASSYASRTMVMSGLILLAFIIFHLSHFTLGLVDPEYLQFHDFSGRHDVYRMVVTGFSKPLITIFYIISMAILFLHLSHGVASSFQSLGLRNQKTVNGFKMAAWVAAVIVFIGNCAIAIAVLAGWVK
jgi:succinate dehydrogenase / fumarate reductase cytochrome b subunit